jgi:exosome complex component RRP45
VAVEGENATIFSIREREPIPLSILHHPICVTFSYYDSGETILVDANLSEEQVREGEVVVTMNKHGEVCQIAKYGGISVDPMALLNCTGVALEKVKDITKLIQRRLEEDAKKKDVGGLIAELSAENPR